MEEKLNFEEYYANQVNDMLDSGDFIQTVQELIDELNKVKDKNVPVRAFFDPGCYELSEKAEISMISFVDDDLDMRVDINLFQHLKHD